MTIDFYIFILNTANHVHKVIETESFIGMFRSLKYNTDRIRAVKTFAWMNTVIAHATVFMHVLFTKVVQ